MLTGICHLGANGGVDLSVIVRHPHFNPDDIKGRYRRVPNVSGQPVSELCLIELYSLIFRSSYAAMR